ncbi:MAG TPA: addiction module antidote protein [Roseomonas sp.]|jgi:probable addiction module antidote protein
MALKTEIFDAADYLKTPEAQAEYLSIALEDGDLDRIKRALGTLARAQGMTEVARAADVGAKSLYKSLGEDGNPAFGTVLRVMHALGLALRAAPARAQDHEAEPA